jgi:DNA-directed RNA polymerase subunit RPC12/RpoP
VKTVELQYLPGFMNYICPDCGKKLELQSYNVEGTKVIALYSCLSCTDGVDKDWKVIYDEEAGTEKVERHFWG